MKNSTLILTVLVFSVAGVAQAKPKNPPPLKICTQVIEQMIHPKTQEKVMARNSCAAQALLAKGFVRLSEFKVDQVEKTMCHNQAVAEAVSHNYQTFKVSTASCGIKPLQISEHLETFTVCTTDETDPMEYIVVIQKHVSEKRLVKTCVVQYIGNTYDAKTPTFEDDTGLITSAKGCSIEDGQTMVCN